MLKVFGFIFLGLALVAFGIVSVKLGWFDTTVNWVKSLFN